MPAVQEDNSDNDNEISLLQFERLNVSKCCAWQRTRTFVSHTVQRCVVVPYTVTRTTAVLSPEDNLY